jgi:hypothetical protein
MLLENPVKYRVFLFGILLVPPNVFALGTVSGDRTFSVVIIIPTSQPLVITLATGIQVNRGSIYHIEDPVTIGNCNLFIENFVTRSNEIEILPACSLPLVIINLLLIIALPELISMF